MSGDEDDDEDASSGSGKGEKKSESESNPKQKRLLGSRQLTKTINKIALAFTKSGSNEDETGRNGS